MLFHAIKVNDIVLPVNLFVAPLAGYTNLATRMIYRRQGIVMCYTEMVSAKGLEYHEKDTLRHLNTETRDRPLGVQLFGPDAESIFKAFLLIKDYSYDLIDINCGCSIKKIIKQEAGAFLLKNPQEIYNIINKIKGETSRPVTLKIRSGWDEKHINYLEVLDAAEKAKAGLITFHPRTRAMIFKGRADWSKIKELKEKAKIPVVGNGDIFTKEDAVTMLKETGCDGIMLARGLIDNPFLIQEVLSSLKNEPYPEPTVEERFKIMLLHCNKLVELFGDRKGTLFMRKFVRGYLKNLPEVAKLRQKINITHSFQEFEKITKDYYEYYQNLDKSFSVTPLFQDE